MKGSTFRRCACRNPETGKQYGKSCPKLSNKRHGLWNVRQELPADKEGNRRTFRRGSYTSKTDAQADLDKLRALLAIPGDDDPDGRLSIGDLLESVASKKEAIPDYEETKRRFRAGQSLTAHIAVGEWLDEWLANKPGRPSALARDEIDIRLHLKPHVGHHRIDRLRVGHLSEMFAAIIEKNIEIQEANAQRHAAVAELAAIPWKGRENRAQRKALKAAIDEMPPFRRPVGASTRQRIRATLRAALNEAIAQQLITFNPAAHVKLDTAKRPKALVWTEERIAEWRRTGERPSPVMVWTPEQTGAFLDHIAGERLYALFHLIAFRGLRRGEACGQSWSDLNLKTKRLTVAKQLVQKGWEVYEDAPKTDSGARTIALDADTVAVLKAHRKRQAEERLTWGEAWVETGRVFTDEQGEWLHPGKVSDLFERLVAESGLPPIRMHDLRHGAATLAHAAGADLKDIQEMLGHSSIAVTADTYTSLLPEVDEALAEAAANLVPRKAKRTAGLTSGSPESLGLASVPAQPSSATKRPRSALS
ncbi:site-specific integrase [Streptomyces spectabilis]|uniref:tyrosine-type recombinase/integrase n=1 Tax=Streptomyces spectabilis TaxID=68270 RepID=UPI0033CBABF9